MLEIIFGVPLHTDEVAGCCSGDRFDGAVGLRALRPEDLEPTGQFPDYEGN